MVNRILLFIKTNRISNYTRSFQCFFNGAIISIIIIDTSGYKVL